MGEGVTQPPPLGQGVGQKHLGRSRVNLWNWQQTVSKKMETDFQ